MGAKSRRKGQKGELEVRDLFRPYHGELTRRGFQCRSGGEQCDVEGTPYWVEVKRLAKVTGGTVKAAWEQARASGDGRPVVVCVRADRGQWEAAWNDRGILVRAPLSDWLLWQTLRQEPTP